MKRIIATLFLSLAVMIIMAHAIIPHHHHQGIPVMLLSEACQKTHNHSANDNHDHGCRHNHETTNSHEHGCVSIEDCLFNNLYIHLEKKKVEKQFDDNHFSKFLKFITLLYVNPVLGTLQYRNLSFREKPYSVSYHSTYITLALGLRAPPMC